jgi:hypothetical protein
MNTILMLLALFNSYTITGQVLFDGEPPPVTSFEVGICEDLGMLCAYSVEPPAPKATMDEFGNFVITGVTPGDYGLVFDFSYFFQIMPWWPDESGEILFTITDNNIDLGVLAYDSIPCDLIPDWRCGNLLALPIVMRND